MNNSTAITKNSPINFDSSKLLKLISFLKISDLSSKLSKFQLEFYSDNVHLLAPYFRAMLSVKVQLEKKEYVNVSFTYELITEPDNYMFVVIFANIAKGHIIDTFKVLRFEWNIPSLCYNLYFDTPKSFITRCGQIADSDYKRVVDIEEIFKLNIDYSVDDLFNDKGLNLTNCDIIRKNENSINMQTIVKQIGTIRKYCISDIIEVNFIPSNKILVLNIPNTRTVVLGFIGDYDNIRYMEDNFKDFVRNIIR